MPVFINDKRLVRSIAGIEASLKNLRKPYRSSASELRDYVRGTITKQGRAIKYKPLAKMTKEITGKRKALLNIRQRIKSSSGTRVAKVFFDGSGVKYTARQHHRGFKSKAVTAKPGKVMKAKGKKSTVYFKSRKAVRIPARKIWPSKAEAVKVVRPIFSKYIIKEGRKKWR